MLAWLLLALVMAAAGADTAYAGLQRTGFGTLLFIAFAYLGLRPAFAWLLRQHAPDGELAPAVFAALMVGPVACAALTEWLHLHVIFGAFLFGCCLPHDDRLLRSLARRIEPLSIVVLLPVFFAMAGPGTTANAFGGIGMQAMVLILAVAIIGKIVGGTAGARLAGYGWQDSLATGSLMNARGLMELIVMKVGLDAGLIGADMFTMLLMMALVTTAMTGPLIAIVSRSPSVRAAAHADAHAKP